MIFFSERLRSDHNLEPFESGNALLDTWLKKHAISSDRSGTGRTYIWLDEAGTAAAYFTLAPHMVRRSVIPARTGRGSPEVIPSILLARLALDRSLHGRGLGGELLADALSMALTAMRVAGGRLIVVDAIDDAAARFYEHHGSAPTIGNPHRLVLKASDAARVLRMPWP